MSLLSPAKSRHPASTAPRFADAYRRADVLPGLLGLWPSEVEDYSPDATIELILKLKRALRAERKRGQARSFTYDLNRHMRLVNALKHELAFLAELRRECPARRDQSLCKTRSGKTDISCNRISP